MGLALLTAVLPTVLSLAGQYFMNKSNNSSGQQGANDYAFSNYDPNQQNVWNQYSQQGMPNLQNNDLYQQGLSHLRELLSSQFNPQQYEQMFQQGVVEPELKNYRERILPSIQSRLFDPGSTHTGALNRAINTSAQDLSQGLAATRANWLQNQQQNFNNDKYNALNQSLGWIQAPHIANRQYFQDITGANPQNQFSHQPSSWLGNLLGDLGKSAPDLINAFDKYRNTPNQMTQPNKTNNAFSNFQGPVGGNNYAQLDNTANQGFNPNMNAMNFQGNDANRFSQLGPYGGR